MVWCGSRILLPSFTNEIGVSHSPPDFEELDLLQIEKRDVKRWIKKLSEGIMVEAGRVASRLRARSRRGSDAALRRHSPPRRFDSPLVIRKRKQGVKDTLFSLLVEAGRVELPSENPSAGFSPSAVTDLGFPSRGAR